ncbi:MAG: polysaccharide deacetylase family protein, partial [Hamadaea sp.]|nr:polysaccharide deacetylase family protein [Hamadaea sp.]
MASIVTITVHGIGPAGRDLAAGEDRTWVDIARFEQMLDLAAARDHVRITFDDGNASDLEIALPRLVQRGLRAEFFVLAGLFGQPGKLDADGVRALVQAGMAIGSHGWAHRDWRRIDEAEAAEEFDRAHDLIGEIAGTPVTSVAVPFGSYDRRVLQRLRHKGVRHVYTSDGGRARPGSWLQPRTSLRHDMDAGWLTSVVDGRPAAAVRARRVAARTVKRLPP